MLKKIILFFSLAKKAFSIAYQWFSGSWHLFGISRPIISIFGGKNVEQDSLYGKQAYILADKLSSNGFFLLTGGGPGAMEAVHCGVISHEKSNNNGTRLSLGIGISGVDEDFVSICGRRFFQTDFLFIRKWLLVHFSKAFIILPGGLGTADELFDVLNLIKLKRITPIPVILVGSQFWKPIITWMESSTAQGFILKEFLGLYTVCDSNEEILEKIGLFKKNK